MTNETDPTQGYQQTLITRICKHNKLNSQTLNKCSWKDGDKTKQKKRKKQTILNNL